MHKDNQGRRIKEEANVVEDTDEPGHNLEIKEEISINILGSPQIKKELSRNISISQQILEKLSTHEIRIWHQGPGLEVLRSDGQDFKMEKIASRGFY